MSDLKSLLIEAVQQVFSLDELQQENIDRQKNLKSPKRRPQRQNKSKEPKKREILSLGRHSDDEKEMVKKMKIIFKNQEKYAKWAEHYYKTSLECDQKRIERDKKTHNLKMSRKFVTINE